jgi:hypothetical protein
MLLAGVLYSPTMSQGMLSGSSHVTFWTVLEVMLALRSNTGQ